MRVCHNEATLRASIKKARQEAQAAFGDGSVFIEKFLEHARHVEVQVLGDKHGHAVHLFERDCSLQRRHQKIIEEAPAPGVDRKKMAAVCESAARLVRTTGYAGAATVEFLMDADQNFYMLEVNTRVQVEHPVTEMVTGVDIVQASIRVAAGEKLGLRQKDVAVEGHAMECRLNAEDPSRNFMPSPGRIEVWEVPGGPGIRLDSHVVPGYMVPPTYDSMVGKLIAHGPDREACIARMVRALRELRIEPIRTMLPLHLHLLEHSAFREGPVDIHYLERAIKQGLLSPAGL